MGKIGKKVKKSKKPTVRQLKKKADKVFSEYIRKRDRGRCYTCGKRGHWKEMQCGHYVRRSCMSLRYDEANAFAQCVRCNIFMSGNYETFALNLLNDFGKERLGYLDKKKKELKQWKLWELEEIIETYKQKIGELK